MSTANPPNESLHSKGPLGFLSRFREGGGSVDPWAASTLVAFGAILVYLNTVTNGFAYDDIPIIVENPAVHDLTNLLRIWLTPYWPGPDARAFGLYRPLTIFLFALQWYIGGGSPLLFHLLNVFLHSAASVLVYHLIKQFVDWRSAFGAALFFAVHPVHVEAVANTVGQAELVSSCLVLMAAVLYVRRPLDGEVTDRLRYLIASFFLMALLAKEHAIVLPALLLVLDLAQVRVPRAGYLRSIAKLGMLLAAIIAVYLSLRSTILGAGLTGDVAFNLQFLRDPASRILTALSVWPEYARLMFTPIHLSAMYDPDTILPPQAITPSVVGGFVLLLSIVVTTGKRSLWPQVGLGSAWFLTTIIPVSNLLFPIGTVLGERTLYLPSVASAIWVGFGLQWISKKGILGQPRRMVVAVVFGIILLAFGGRAVLRNPVWSDNETLFETTFRAHPENFRAQWLHARRLVEMGDSAGSGPHWRRAFEIYSGHTGFLTDYARFLFANGNLREADDMVARALEFRPDSPDGLFFQGLIDIALERGSQAKDRAGDLAELGFSRMADQLTDSLNAAQRQTTR